MNNKEPKPTREFDKIVHLLEIISDDAEMGGDKFPVSGIVIFADRPFNGIGVAHFQKIIRQCSKEYLIKSLAHAIDDDIILLDIVVESLLRSHQEVLPLIYSKLASSR